MPRRGDQGPKTIDQIHKEAELEEHREQIKVQQQLMSKKDSGGGGGGGGRMGGNMGGRGPHTPGGGRTNPPQDEGWNTVPISKNRPIDTTRLSKITKVMLKSNKDGLHRNRNAIFYSNICSSHLCLFSIVILSVSVCIVINIIKIKST